MMLRGVSPYESKSIISYYKRVSHRLMNGKREMVCMLRPHTVNPIKVLDVGCGLGEMLTLAREKYIWQGMTGFGIDSSKKMIEAATLFSSEIQFAQRDFFEWFDVRYSLHHTSNDKEMMYDLTMAQAVIHLWERDEDGLKKLLDTSSNVVYVSTTECENATLDLKWQQKDTTDQFRLRRNYTYESLLELCRRCADRPFVLFRKQDSLGKMWLNAVFFHHPPPIVRRLLKSNGWVHIFNLIPSSVCVESSDIIRQIIDTPPSLTEGYSVCDRYADEQGRVYRLERFLEKTLKSKINIDEVIKRVFGPDKASRVWLLKDKVNIKYPASEMSFPPHQDGAAWKNLFEGVKPSMYTSLAIALTTQSEQNGGVSFWSRRQTNLFPENPLNPKRFTNGGEWICPHVQQGDAIWFSALTPHKSGANRSSSGGDSGLRMLMIATFVERNNLCRGNGNENAMCDAFFARKNARYQTYDTGMDWKAPRDAFGKIL